MAAGEGQQTEEDLGRAGDKVELPAGEMIGPEGCLTGFVVQVENPSEVAGSCDQEEADRESPMQVAGPVDEGLLVWDSAYFG